MGRYSTMVIELYKSVLLNGNISHERLLEANKEISNAITEARVMNNPTEYLESLKKDLLDLYALA